MAVIRTCKSCYETYDESVEGDHNHCEDCYYDPFTNDDDAEDE
jgi:protein-arginine kinase activator protein McsA